MKLSDFDYHLPNNLIATQPINPRDNSRLLVLDKNSKKIKHQKFFNLIDFLKKGDLLIFNNSQVIPARIIAKKEKTGGQVEIFLHKKDYQKNEKEIWECLLKGKNLKENLVLKITDDFFATVLKNNNNGTFLLEFDKKNQEFIKIVEKIGKIPLPPYIIKNRKKDFAYAGDRENYQTVYANKKKKGSVAAPTAGLHFTKRLLKKIKDHGVDLDYLALHVGMGTFAPVKTNDLLNHKMHAEWVEVPAKLIKKIKKVKKNNGRIITVGTTSTRALEAIFSSVDLDDSKDYAGWVDIFIYPGYNFKIVDAMITNFHLPKSTLLMLISAFSSIEQIKQAYQAAIEKKYRFYSYGDAMLLY